MSNFLSKLPIFLANHWILSTLLTLLLIALVVVQTLLLKRKFKAISPAELTLLINRESPLLIDLSSRADYEKSHLPGSRHVMPSQFDPEHKDLAKAKELPVVLIDKDGRGLDSAAQRLIKAGFSRVYLLGGGVAGWRQAQLPLAKGGK